jgi:hypothetical protein
MLPEASGVDLTSWTIKRRLESRGHSEEHVTQGDNGMRFRQVMVIPTGCRQPVTSGVDNREAGLSSVQLVRRIANDL